MNRTPFPPHALNREPVKTIMVALSLALFVAASVLYRATGLLVAFVVWTVALMYFGFRAAQKQLRDVEQERARALKSHSASMADRMLFAQRQGWEYEASSAELAEGFGRIAQEVTGRPTEETEAIARHAAELVAEGVLRGRIDGLPVTVFDLEMINYDDMRELRKRCRYGRAAEASKDYLTVCAVELPVRLPYVASAHLMSHAEEALRTADVEFARFLLSHPAVRESALDPDHLWSVAGDRLLACTVSNDGLDVPQATSLAARTAAVAAAFPWPELERFRLPEPDEPPRHILWVFPWEWPDGQGARRWDEQPIGRTDLRAFRSHPAWLDTTALLADPAH